MGVYRSDQAQLTFGTEPFPGAFVELASSVSAIQGSTTAALYGDHNSGVSKIQMDGLTGTNYDTANYTNWIGANIHINSATPNLHKEIRRIEHIALSSGSIYDVYLNAPLAFSHSDNAVITPVMNVTTDADDIFLDSIPGVYETVEVPDPENALEARYFLGTGSKRNFFAAYRGQQTYVGSVPGFILLNGRPLRYPIGRVVSRASNADPTAFTVPLQVKSSGSYTAKKGDVYVRISTNHGSSTQALVVGTIIVFEGLAANATIDATSRAEIRKVVSVSASPIPNTSGEATIQLDHPLNYEHLAASTIKYYPAANTVWEHTILETVDLDNVTWHVHMRDSSENAELDFDRSYFGGKIGGATLSADEGGMLTMSWDGVNFLGMVHNQKAHSVTSTAGASDFGTGEGNGITDNTNARMTLPYYGVMQDIDNTVTGHVSFPTTEPYYFSQGSVSLFGTELARIRSFSLSVSNNEEPRYYLQKRYGRNRGPNEIREQQREYALAVTLALPDATDAEGGEWDYTKTLFKELILEGNYGDGVRTDEAMRGFNVSLTFEKGINDSITITIPDDGAANTGGNEQGAFIRTAPHSITGDNPLQVDADILFRNLKIVVKETDDLSYFYP